MNLRHATLHQLRIFLAVARHSSFARAAEELHLSPPTLSLQAKGLRCCTLTLTPSGLLARSLFLLLSLPARCLRWVMKLLLLLLLLL